MTTWKSITDVKNPPPLNKEIIIRNAADLEELPVVVLLRSYEYTWPVFEIGDSDTLASLTLKEWDIEWCEIDCCKFKQVREIKDLPNRGDCVLVRDVSDNEKRVRVGVLDFNGMEFWTIDAQLEWDYIEWCEIPK